MPASAFDDYSGYMNQRVAAVSGGNGWEDEFLGDNAIGFVISDGGVEPDEARATLLEAVRPADVVVQDSRREHDWGASGPMFHELLIGFSAGVPASIVAAALVEAVRALVRKVRRSDDVPEPEPMTDEALWQVFETFVGFAMKARNARLVEIERRDGYWYVKAETSRGMIEGGVEDGGEIVRARIVTEGQEPFGLAD